MFRTRKVVPNRRTTQAFSGTIKALAQIAVVRSTAAISPPTIRMCRTLAEILGKISRTAREITAADMIIRAATAVMAEASEAVILR